jgi:hypothetical protein
LGQVALRTPAEASAVASFVRAPPELCWRNAVALDPRTLAYGGLLSDLRGVALVLVEGCVVKPDLEGRAIIHLSAC